MTQILLFVIIYGVGYGGTIPVSSSLRASYFGRKAYATITGYVTLFTAITNIVYPVFAGWTYDATGSYLGLHHYCGASGAIHSIHVLRQKA